MTDSTPSMRMSPSRHTLPAEVASFIGREHEIAEIEHLLTQTRLLTLTGAGGSGKTRLALRVAGKAAPAFMDGAWLVQLAPVADSGMVIRAVASALGIHGTAGQSELTTLVTALASRRLLLVLDNCEHLIGACARLAQALLVACPHLRILATSREPLRVVGETTWRVPPLQVPPMGLEGEDASPESLARIGSVALFVDRARARRPDFRLTEDNAVAVAGICRRLEGLPLAVELAAAQVGGLPPVQIARLLNDALRVLGGGSWTEPRQETLRGALDWSHGLLSGEEQLLLRRLSVFARGFDVEAVEGVCGGGRIERAGCLPLLMGLVDKSLVEPVMLDNAARFRLLEPVRQYAWQHLVDRDDVEAVQRRHAQYFLLLAETAEPSLMSGERRRWMARLAREEDNLRSALIWSRHADSVADREIGLRLAGALSWYWNFSGAVAEGPELTEAALARGRDAAPEVRAKALYGACELAWLAGKASLARERAEESEALWRALGDKRGLAYTLQSLPLTNDHPRARECVAESLRLFAETGDEWGAALATGAADVLPLIRGDDPTGEGRTALEEGLARARAVGDDWVVAQRLNFLGDLARSQGDDEAAQARYEEALHLLRRQGLTGTVPSLLHNLGYMAVHEGEVRRALLRFRESLALFRDQGDQRGIADCLDGMAAVLVAMKQPERAAELFGAAEGLRTVIASAVWPGNAADRQRGLDTIRTELDEADLAAAWEAGRARPISETVGGILAEDVQSPLLSAGTGPDLTRREWEVAALVVRGLTNRQIAGELFITEGTARLHVKHILNKLGFTSRAQIATWVTEQGTAPSTTAP